MVDHLIIESTERFVCVYCSFLGHARTAHAVRKYQRQNRINAVSAVQLGAGWVRRAVALSSRRIAQLLIVDGSTLLCLWFPQRGGILSEHVWIFFKCRSVMAWVVPIAVGSPVLTTLAIMRPTEWSPRHVCNMDIVEFLQAAPAVPAFRILGARACYVGEIHTHLAL